MGRASDVYSRPWFSPTAARRYLTDPDELAELARSRIRRDLTAAECARYLPDEECRQPVGAGAA